MTTQDDRLTKVEERLLHELLAFRAHLATTSGEPNRIPAADDIRPSPKLRRAALIRRLVPAGTLAAAMLAVLVLLVVRAASPGVPALAATPPPLHYHPFAGGESGRDVLLRLASAASRQPDSTVGSGPYAYVKTAGWYLNTRVAAGQSSSTVVPTVIESWTAADGSGLIVKRAAAADGPELLSVPSGEILDRFTTARGSHVFAGPLSTDPSILTAQLDNGHPTENGPSERFVALKDLALERTITPRLESAILRVLAASPGLINSGDVVDRAGRTGVAVSIDSAYSGLSSRYTFIFAPNGALLGVEETLIGDPRKLNVRLGSVLSYTAFLSSAQVPDTTSRR